MDAGLIVRPIDGGAQTAFAQPSSAPVPQAVATDLAPSQAVAAAASAVGTRNDPHAGTSGGATTRVDIAVDKRTHEVVYRIVDAQTGRLIIQVPSQAHTDITV